MTFNFFFMSQEQKFAITAATDGACSGNPGPGGWGALIRFQDGSEVEFGGFDPETTNNRMELQAALVVFKEIKDLPRSLNLVIKTDSKYLIDGMEKWMPNWKKKGWKTSSGKPVLNQDLWKALDDPELPKIKLQYVKGHSGEKDNDRVDAIAVAFSKGRKIELKDFVKK
jgi:ribonuclease HI